MNLSETVLSNGRRRTAPKRCLSRSGLRAERDDCELVPGSADRGWRRVPRQDSRSVHDRTMHWSFPVPVSLSRKQPPRDRGPASKRSGRTCRSRIFIPPGTGSAGDRVPAVKSTPCQLAFRFAAVSFKFRTSLPHKSESMRITSDIPISINFIDNRKKFVRVTSGVRLNAVTGPSSPRLLRTVRRSGGGSRTGKYRRCFFISIVNKINPFSFSLQPGSLSAYQIILE